MHKLVVCALCNHQGQTHNLYIKPELDMQKIVVIKNNIRHVIYTKCPRNMLFSLQTLSQQQFPKNEKNVGIFFLNLITSDYNTFKFILLLEKHIKSGSVKIFFEILFRNDSHPNKIPTKTCALTFSLAEGYPTNINFYQTPTHSLFCRTNLKQYYIIMCTLEEISKYLSNPNGTKVYYSLYFYL